MAVPMRRATVIGLLTAAAACGGGGGQPRAPVTPTPPTKSYTVTISAGSVTPKELTVPPGTRVLFVNSDSRPRNMTSDPHPEHDDCTEIRNVGVINPGQSKETGNLVTVRTCAFHDDEEPGNTNLRGSIIIR